VVAFSAAAGRGDIRRFAVYLPDRLALPDRAVGMNHGELTGRSLQIPGSKTAFAVRAHPQSRTETNI